ncbi:MAG: histone deacetylase, partial [Myxococcota bacterium]
RASVWLPGGGYTRGAWRVLAGTALALAARTRLAIPRSYDPLRARFSHIAQGLSPESLGSEPLLTEEDVAEALGVRSKARPRLLGFYTSEGLEFAFYRYGILPHLHRLGYDRLHVELDEVSGGGRVRVMGFSDGKDQVLMEAVLEKKQLAGSTVLFVNWLSLRNPRARFSDKRPQLPGQEVPGLGLARETAELLGLMARRLVLDGVAFRPAWFHIAYAGRYRARFVDPARQGRFEALMRDLKHLSLLKATTAVAQGRVRLDGKPYQWEADDMVYWLSRDEKQAEAEIAAERERAHFTVEA